MKVDNVIGYDWFKVDIVTKLDPITAISLRDTFGLKMFIETGTCAGVTTEMAALMFETVLTCELHPAKYPQATARLTRYRNVYRSFWDSEAFLRSIKWKEIEPSFVWLDAHWTGDGPRPPKDSPVLEELKLIGGHHGKHCVVLDDARILDTEGWPSSMDVLDLATAQGFSPTSLGDCLIFTPSTWKPAQ